MFHVRVTGQARARRVERKAWMFFIFFTGPARILQTCADVKINLKHDNPIFEPARRHGPAEQENQKCAEMLAAGLIEPNFPQNMPQISLSPLRRRQQMASGPKSACMCNDVRALNEATITDHYHAAVIEEPGVVEGGCGGGLPAGASLSVLLVTSLI